MRARRPWLLLIVCPLTLALAIPWSRGENNSEESQRFDEARSLMEAGKLIEAGPALKKFVEAHPKSDRAPEARYRLAVVYYLLGNTPDLTEASNALLDRHPDSPWARLVIERYLSVEELAKRAEAKRKDAAGAGGKQAARQAETLYSAYANRVAARQNQATPLQPHEVTYKSALAAKLAGDFSVYKARLESLAQQDQNGNWGRLAALRLMPYAPDGVSAFREKMGDLASFDTNSEAAEALLELVGHFSATLPDEDRIRCDYLRGLCLTVLGRKDESAALWRQLAEKHPQSPLAAEALFCLARAKYREGDAAAARQELARLAERFPRCARADVARRWVEPMGNDAQTWTGFEELLNEWTRNAGVAAKGVSFTARLRTPDEGWGGRLRLAWQGADYFLLSMEVGDKKLTVGNCKSGAWFHHSGARYAVRSRTALMDPSTLAGAAANMVQLSDDNSLSFGFGAGTLPLAPKLPIPATDAPLSAPTKSAGEAKLAGYAVKWLKSIAFAAREPGKEPGTTVYRFEDPGLDRGKGAEAPMVYELVIDEKRSPRAFRARSSREGKEAELIVEDIRVGEPLPDKVFQPNFPAGVEVREVESINYVDLAAGVLSVHSDLLAALFLGEKK